MKSILSKLIYLGCITALFQAFYCYTPPIAPVEYVNISKTDTIKVLCQSNQLDILIDSKNYQKTVNLTNVNNDLKDTVVLTYKLSGNSYDTAADHNFEWVNDTLMISIKSYIYKRDSLSQKGRVLAKQALSPIEPFINIDTLIISNASEKQISITSRNYY